MSCCCTNIFLDYCEIGTCDDDVFNTKIVAQKDGVHKLVFEFLGVDYEIESEELTIGSDIVFPTKGMNESAEFTGKIIDPDNEQVTFTQDTVEFDCFIIRTKIKYSLTQPVEA